MMQLKWMPGSLANWDGPFYISTTRFTYRHLRHMPWVAWHGLRLRSGWAEVEGAVGLSISTDFFARTTYTVSVWRTQEDLRRWVRSPVHAALMRGYRPYLLNSAADGWLADSFDLRHAWKEARDRVGLPNGPLASSA